MLKSQVGNCIKKCLCLAFENWNMTLCEAGDCSNTAHKKKGKSFFFFLSQEKLRKARLGAINRKDELPKVL